MRKHQRVEILRNAGDLKIPMTDITAIKWGPVTIEDTATGEEFTLRRVDLRSAGHKTIETINHKGSYHPIDDDGKASPLGLPNAKCVVEDQDGRQWALTRIN